MREVKKLIKSFSYAFKGLCYAFSTQLNFKIHTFCTIIAVVLGFTLSLSAFEWLWICTAIATVIIVELLNTAIEVLVDLVSPEFNVKAGIIKDVSAGAVVIAALFAVIIGLLIFVPKLFVYVA